MDVINQPILHILTGESPEQTRKLVAHEKIEHWPKFSASEGTKLIRNSWALLKAYKVELPMRKLPMREKCLCWRESMRLH